MARQTSIRAYNNEVQGFKNKLYPKILETLHEIDKDGEGATRGEIAFYSKMEKSTVSARVNEMLKLEILQEAVDLMIKNSAIYNDREEVKK